MDGRRCGTVLINDLACFLRGHLNFNITDSQLYGLQNHLDSRGRYGISRATFIAAVGAPAQENVEEEAEAEVEVKEE